MGVIVLAKPRTINIVRRPCQQITCKTAEWWSTTIKRHDHNRHSRIYLIYWQSPQCYQSTTQPQPNRNWDGGKSKTNKTGFPNDIAIALYWFDIITPHIALPTHLCFYHYHIHLNTTTTTNDTSPHNSCTMQKWVVISITLITLSHTVNLFIIPRTRSDWINNKNWLWQHNCHFDHYTFTTVISIGTIYITTTIYIAAWLLLQFNCFNY